jgi:hypothetical protein
MQIVLAIIMILQKMTTCFFVLAGIVITNGAYLKYDARSASSQGDFDLVHGLTIVCGSNEYEIGAPEGYCFGNSEIEVT